MTAVLRKPRRSLALEMVDFQDNSFGKRLEANVAEIVTAVRNGTTDVSDLPACKQLPNLIFERLGLQVKLTTNADIAAILPFYLNKNHIFIDDMLKGEFSIEDQQSIINKAHLRQGTVNIAKAKVTGIFSEYQNLLFINFFDLVTNYSLTAPEITAIMLHELGHAFYACEYSDRIASTNQVLANVAKEMVGNSNKDLTYIYKELQSIDSSVTTKTIDDIVNGNRTIAGIKLFKIAINAVNSQLPNSKYQETSFEQMADNFASRFGYSRPLVTALDKLHDYFGNPERSVAANSLVLILTALGGISSLVGIVATITVGMIPITMYLGLVTGLLFMLSGDDSKDYTYDDLKIRYKRIRNDQINILKSSNLSTAELTELLANIYRIDTIIKQTYEFRSAISKIANIILPANRKTVNALREEQMLEDLASNELFVLSAQFKLHSKG